MTGESLRKDNGDGLAALRRSPPTNAVTMAPYPARGTAKVHIGPRSRVPIPAGPPVQPSLNIDELEQVLTGLREWT